MIKKINRLKGGLSRKAFITLVSIVLMMSLALPSGLVFAQGSADGDLNTSEATTPANNTSTDEQSQAAAEVPADTLDPDDTTQNSTPNDEKADEVAADLSLCVKAKNVAADAQTRVRIEAIDHDQDFETVEREIALNQEVALSDIGKLREGASYNISFVNTPTTNTGETLKCAPYNITLAHDIASDDDTFGPVVLHPNDSDRSDASVSFTRPIKNENLITFKVQVNLLLISPAPSYETNSSDNKSAASEADNEADDEADAALSNFAPRALLGSSVTYVSPNEDTMTEGGWTQKTRYMEIDGKFALCAQHFKSTPSQGTSASVVESVVANDAMRKVAWYGYGGPGDLGYRLVETACMMNNANNEQEVVSVRDRLNNVLAQPSPPASFVLIKWSTGNGSTQDMITWTYTPNGYLHFQKYNSDPDITAGNDCYTLAGAVYNLYKADGSFVRSITTPESGYVDLGEIEAGSYYFVEVTPPPGFHLNTDPIWITVPAGGEATATTSDIPYNDPVDALLHKYDPATGGTAQGQATFAGAEFTVHYYAGTYNSGVDPATLGVASTRTWIMATDEDGFCFFDNNYVIADRSDDFYLSPYDGKPTFPLGTVTVQETKAPEGYLLSTDGLPNSVFVQRITSEGIDGNNVEVWNEHEFLDQVKAGECWITKVGTKVGDHTTDDDSADAIPLAGVEFSLYTSKDFIDNGDDTYRVKDGSNPYAVITTDENGIATTKYLERPDTQHGALVFDTYLVVETKPAPQYDPIKPFVFKASEDAKTYYFLANDTFINAGVQLMKIDAESHLPVLVAGTQLQILDENKTPIVFHETYPEEKSYDTLVVGKTGTVLLPNKLNAGSYFLREIKAPDGYVINHNDVPFVVATTTWDNPLVVSYADMPQKGTIKVIKSDERDNRYVSGAVYEVSAAKDIKTGDGVVQVHAGEVVATLTTNAQGAAETDKLYLGEYNVKETITPDGWAIDRETHHVSLTYAGQEVEVAHTTLETKDAPTAFKLIKQAQQPDGELIDYAGSRWHVWATDAAGQTVYDKTVATDENGGFELDYIPHGQGLNYFCQEIKTGDDYIIDDKVYKFQVDKDGTIDGKATYTLKNINYHKRTIIFHKQDSQTEGPVSDTLFTLEKWSGKGKPVDAGGDDTRGEWVEVGQLESDALGDAIFDGLGWGWYHLVETYQNPDYMSPDEGGFAGEFYLECSASTGISQIQVFEDTPITVETNVKKETIAQTSAGLIYTDDKGNTISNVGREAYRYDVSFDNGNTNVFADEYYVIDQCQMTQSPYDLRINSLVTPVLEGVTDNKLSLLIKTNKASNNARDMSFTQPNLHEDDTLCDGSERFDSSEYNFVGEYSATEATQVNLSDYLDDDEYVVGIALCCGAVEVGFKSVESMSYLVSASHELEVGTVIPNTVSSHITRNWSSVHHTAHGDEPKELSGPHDDAYDNVSTTVISTFDVDFSDDLTDWSAGGKLISTGDMTLFFAGLGLVLVTVASMVVVAVAQRKKAGAKK